MTQLQIEIVKTDLYHIESVFDVVYRIPAGDQSIKRFAGPAFDELEAADFSNAKIVELLNTPPDQGE